MHAKDVKFIAVSIAKIVVSCAEYKTILGPFLLIARCILAEVAYNNRVAAVLICMGLL